MTYNENLNTAVVNSLQRQDLDVRSVYSKKNASMFTLYYTQGATISAEEKLNASTDEMETKAKAKTQAVNDSNLCNNLLASATQANQYNKQAVTNTAVCAANIQVAATSIVRLASDIGSIFSIIQAADKNTEMYIYTDNVRQHINKTAYAAETISQVAMQTSILASEISTSTVQDKSTSTCKLMNNMLKITSSDFDAVSQVVAEDNAVLAAISAKESLAEGVLEDVAVDFEAATNAYNSTNKELNLNLNCRRANAESNTIYEITFSEIKKLFEGGADPVDDYYLMVVKESKKLIFSLPNADIIRANRSFKPLQILHITSKNLEGMAANIDFFNINLLVEPPMPVDKPAVMKDSDGDDMIYGTPYVLFVMAVYNPDYKREINNFSDFLSASSKKIILTQHVKAIDGSTIKSAMEVDVDQKKVIDPEKTTTSTQKSEHTFELLFTGNPGGTFPLTHRCIFLPFDPTLTKGLINRETFYKRIEGSEKEHLKLEIHELNEQIKYLTSQLPSLKTSLDAAKKLFETASASLAEFVKDHPNPKGADLAETKKLQQAHNLASADFDEQTNNYTGASQAIKDAEQQQTLLEKAAEPKKTVTNLGFFFNLALAEQVSPSNYTEAIEIPQPSQVVGAPKHYRVLITPETTDNFGNLLIDGGKYVPVILSQANSDKPANYTSAISDVSITKHFTYQQNINLLNK